MKKLDVYGHEMILHKIKRPGFDNLAVLGCTHDGCTQSIEHAIHDFIMAERRQEDAYFK